MDPRKIIVSSAGRIPLGIDFLPNQELHLHLYAFARPSVTMVGIDIHGRLNNELENPNNRVWWKITGFATDSSKFLFVSIVYNGVRWAPIIYQGDMHRVIHTDPYLGLADQRALDKLIHRVVKRDIIDNTAPTSSV